MLKWNKNKINVNRKYRSSHNCCPSCGATHSAVGCLNRMCKRYVGDEILRDHRGEKQDA